MVARDQAVGGEGGQPRTQGDGANRGRTVFEGDGAAGGGRRDGGGERDARPVGRGIERGGQRVGGRRARGQADMHHMGGNEVRAGNAKETAGIEVGPGHRQSCHITVQTHVLGTGHGGAIPLGEFVGRACASSPELSTDVKICARHRQCTNVALQISEG